MPRDADGHGFSVVDAPIAETKRPLMRELPPCPSFPVAALGPLRPAAEALHDRVQVPPAIAAQSVLAATTLAVQPHRDVEIPEAGRRPLTGLFVSVAESGERKTSCDRIALRAVYRFEEALREQHAPKQAAYLADREAWKAASDAAKKAGKRDRAAIRDALIALGQEPKPPPHPMLLITDPTPEALVMHLANGHPWAGVFTDEGGTLIGGHAMNDDNRMRTGALLNTLWDGGAIRRLRMGSGTTFLPGRRCSAHVMMQGAVATQFFGDAVLSGLGTHARVLLVAPESTAGTRMFRESSIVTETALRDHDARLSALLSRTPRTSLDDGDVLDPPPISFAPEARHLWVAFHDASEAELRRDGEFAGIRALGSKLAEHAARLAAVQTVYADPDAAELSAEAVANGIELAQHYAAEAIRLGAATATAPNLMLAQQLLAWWQARPDPRCHLAAIYQRGLNAIGDAATARRLVAILEDHGWITRLPIGSNIDGVTRKEVWELVP